MVRAIVRTDPLGRLARALLSVLAAAPARVIDNEMILLARRHQVAALLTAACEDAVCQAELAQDYRASTLRRGKSLARLEQIAAQFQTCGIAWRVLKGTTQAAQLYADPAWRYSA